jgi:hypothetical protein
LNKNNESSGGDMEIDDDISSNTISLAHLSDYNPIPQFQTSIH